MLAFIADTSDPADGEQPKIEWPEDRPTEIVLGLLKAQNKTHEEVATRLQRSIEIALTLERMAMYLVALRSLKIPLGDIVPKCAPQIGVGPHSQFQRLDMLGIARQQALERL